MRYILLIIYGIFATFAAQAETITIAAEDDWAPYSSIKADKSGPEGLVPELVKKVFKLKGVDVKFITLPFARCMHDTLTGKIVGCFDASITNENKDQYYWHQPMLFTEGVTIFALANSPKNHVGIKEMEGTTVSYTIGYTYGSELMNNKKINLFGTTSDHHQLNMVVNGRVQYAIINTLPGLRLINQDPLLKGKLKMVGKISEDAFWLAFSRKHPDGKRLMETFQSGLVSFKASGEYDKLMQNFKSRYSIK